MRALRIAALALSVCASCADTFIGAEPAADRATVFDEAWHDIDLHYSFFEYKKINWDSLGVYYRPLALAATTDQEFAKVLGRMMAELRDPHVALTPFGTGGTIRYISPFETIATYFDPGLVAQYVPNGRLTEGGHILYGMAAPDVGYLRIESFAGRGWAFEVDRALEMLPAARSLILDVRGNTGGDRALAIEVAGRFADRSRTFGFLRVRNGPGHGDFSEMITEVVSPAGPRQFTGPVCVLTNRRNFSSAEELILAMRVLPTATIIGDTTAGASGGPIVRELRNGWTYQLSEWIEYTAEGQVFEGIGLPPDVVVKSTEPDARARRDAVLEHALALGAAYRGLIVPSRPLVSPFGPEAK